MRNNKKQREAASRALHKCWKDPEYRKAHSRRLKKQWEDSTYRKKITEAASQRMKKKWKEDPEFRKKMAKASSRRMKKKWHTDPDFVKRVINKNLSLGRASPSKVQINTFKALQKLGIKGLKLEFKVDRYHLDIACLKTKQCVEVDGVYWHKNRKTQDRKRDRVLRKLGWQIIRVKTPITEEKLKSLHSFFSTVRRFPRVIGKI